MHLRFALALMGTALGACSAVTPADRDAASLDAREEAATPDAQRSSDASAHDAVTDAIARVPPTKLRVASDAALYSTAIHRAGGRLYSAVLWGGLRSHENVTLVSFDADQNPGSDGRIIGNFFYRSGVGTNRLAPSSIAVSGDRIAVAIQRAGWVAQGSTGVFTQLVLFSTDDRERMLVADYSAPPADTLSGATLQAFEPSVVATADGFLVLDMLGDKRLRLTRVDRAGSVQMQRLFALPFTVTDESTLSWWAVHARGEAFVIATNDEQARLLFVDERGISNETAAIQPISRVFSVPFLCAGDGDEFEFAQTAANSATLWALHVSPERALASVPLDEDRALRMCARPRQWLRTQRRTEAHESAADIWDATAMQSRCASELRAPNALVQRTIDVSGSLAIACDAEADNIDLRPIVLDECLIDRGR
ncbi:MAG: hypothetical protein U0269_18665 [Polyangiales bacterium]